MIWTILARFARILRVGFRIGAPLLVLVALGIALIMFVFPAADLWFVWRVYRRFVETLANATGLNRYLVMAGALLGFVVFYRAVSLVLYHPFNSRKRWLGIGLLLILAVGYNLTLYAATKDTMFDFAGVAHKFYAITPSGVRFYARPGVDPDYGIPLKPVTPDNIRTLELLRRGEFVPVDPAAARFFNPITGKAELWYTKDEAGALTFYDKPGFDPKSGASLEPVTPEVYRAWKKAHEDAERARKQAEEDAEKARRAALSEQQRRKEDAERLRRATEEADRIKQRLAEEQWREAELDCRIAAEKREKERPKQSQAQGSQPYGWGAMAFATTTIMNVWRGDALYDKCVHEARKRLGW